MRRSAKRLPIGMAVLSSGLVALALGAVVVSAKSVTVAAGNMVLTFDAEVTPKALSRNELTPITFRLGVGVETRDGSHAPAARSFEGEIDRNGALNTKGLPVCQTKELEARTTEGARKACSASLIGQGFAKAEVEFPEQAPFDAEGPLLIFNGGTKGKETLILAHVYASVPAPTAFVTPIHITEIDHGRYGLRFAAKIPVIAGGAGSLTSVTVTNRKTFTYKGEKQSYFLAKCPTGGLLGRGELSFSDGSRLQGSVVEPCTPKS